MKPKVKVFLIIENILFLFFFMYLYKYQLYSISAKEIVFFILALFLTTNLSAIIKTGRSIFISISLPILLPAMVVLGPFWTGILGLIGTIEIYQIIYKTKWYKFTFNRTTLFLAAGSGALVFKYSNIYLNSKFFILPLLLASITYFIINNGLVFLVVRFSNPEEADTSLWLYYLELSKNLISSYFLGLVFYYSYNFFGPIFLVLSILLIFILKDFLLSRVQQLNSFTQIVESFLKVIDSKDHYTEGHCERVANYTFILCEALNLSKAKTERIVNMAKIHDIGKIYVDDRILKSSEKLSKPEYEEMKKHSEYGYELLKDIDLLKQDIEIIRYHHERYDGDGYPEGLKGEEIPLGARILNICDSFDVMTTGRSYKPALNKNEVIEEIKTCSSAQFDPSISNKMIELLNKGKFDDSFKNQGKKINENIQLSLI